MVQDVNISNFEYSGGMDLDSTLQLVRAGDALSCLNITNVNLSGQGDSITAEINGNSFSFQLPVITTQNKQYSFSISEVSQPKTYVVDFLNLNLTQFATATVTTTGVIATDVAAFQTSISSALSAYTPVISNTITGGVATFLLSLTAVTGFDWVLKDDLSATALTNPVITMEAIDPSLTNPNNGHCLPIGGIEYLGDLFMFSSCQTQTPIINQIQSAGDNAGVIDVSVMGDVSAIYTVGSSVNVQGVDGVPANGIWIISSSSFLGFFTVITLYNSVFSGSYISGGTITIYHEGYLAITVNQKNKGTGVWTTTPLLGTKALDNKFYNPFRKEINATTQVNRTCIYWTDGFDFPRLFQYQGAYMTNGAINYYNPLGLYSYDGIEISLRNIQNTISPIVQVTNVVDSGGAKNSGNWAYTGRYLDINLTPTGVGIISQPVNIYNGSFANSSQIVGTPGSPTSMLVTVTVSDIPANVFPYFELIGIQYLGGSESAFIIKRVPIPPDVTTMEITDTGLETGVIPYTDGFVLPSSNIKSAGTQTICSNTLMYANLTEVQINDFSSFTQTFTHTLQCGTDILKPLGDDSVLLSSFKFGEYQPPLYTAKNVGYMLNETDRFWACYEFFNGSFTPLFWIDDIRFDIFTMSGVPFNRAGIKGNRRAACNILSYDLSQSPQTTDPENINSYVFYLTFGNINTDYIIDGVPFNEIVKRIHIFRTDDSRLNEVLACGLSSRHVGGTYTTSGNTVTGANSTGASNYLFDSPFLFRGTNISQTQLFPVYTNTPPINVGTNNNSFLTFFPLSEPSWNYGVWTTSVNSSLLNSFTPHSSSFYCPDWIFGQIDISYKSGDSVLCYGQPSWDIEIGADASFLDATISENNGTLVTQFDGSEIRLSGNTNITNDPYSDTSINLPLSQSTLINQYNSNPYSILSNTIFYCPQYKITASGSDFEWSTPQHIWLYCSAVFNNNNPVRTADLGLYYCQYYRNLGSATAYSTGISKFGAITTGTGIPTGAYIDIS